ncbi:MAG: AMP-binding protein [Candidatus Omnitrophica bacterium]|nr:AMP-binding protein [Candidatus Omnitrophota bacterium]
MRVAKVLESRVADYPNKTAFIFRDKAISFGQLKDTVFHFANSLAALDIKKGDKIAIYLPNCPEYIYSYLAIWCLGATAVPLDFMLTEEELVTCLSHSEAKILISRPKENISFAALKKKCHSLKDIICCHENVKGIRYFDDLLYSGNNTFEEIEIHERDYAIIFYTSGTTGRPKGVLINYMQLAVPPNAMDHFVDLNNGDITLCALPFSHLGGLIYIQNCISFGLTVVLMDRFTPLEFLKNIESHKITCFWLVPSMYYALLHLKEFEKFDLSSLRWIVTFGASNSPDALRRFNQFCPNAHLLNGWGLTETNAPTTVLKMGSKKIESVGRPAPWAEVKIVDEHARLLPPGQIGEIVVKGAMVTDGYYKDPEATKEAFKNGWFHTGDLGKFDEEGDLYIMGRKKEMIKVSGEIVFEPEVEAALLKHPFIAEAAVIGMPDKLRGEVPKAFVVLKKEKPLQEEELRYFLREHLAHFKIPHSFEFRDSLPKNRTGKIDKPKLRDTL